MKVPTSTYRLQLNAGFRLSHVRELIPYFSALGVGHLYLSPIFEARPRSPHGYDVTNPNRINHEIGDEAEFAELSSELHAAGIGILLDLVPNHMAADTTNPWWRDVLEHGPASLAARFFDIAWNAPGANSRVVLPILGCELDRCVKDGEFHLTHCEGEIAIAYFKRLFPLDPATYGFVINGISGAEEIISASREIGSRRLTRMTEKEQRREKGIALKRQLHEWLCADPRRATALNHHLDSFPPGKLLALLEQQAYQLEFWRTGIHRLNYRRFFDINDLAAVRVEDRDVFMTTHALTLELLRTGQVDGIRVDHIDGLRDPAGYLQQLRAAMDDSYVVVEKVLAPGEDLPEYWPIEGTTGYDFLGHVTGLYCNAEGLAQLSVSYARRTGMAAYSDVVYEKKKLVMPELFAAELESLTSTLSEAVAALELSMDRETIAACITEVSAAMHVYRTYIDEEVDGYDRAVIKHAVTVARHRAPQIPDTLFALMRNLLVGDDVPESVSHMRASFVADWQQFTGPVTAKGLEDTASYVYNRLIAQNEVGAQPDSQLASGAEFLAAIGRRALRWPHAMNASSTHDTKRSEDVRSRIAVLSEMPEMWDAALERWLAMTESYDHELEGRRVPTVNDKILIFQTLVGVWQSEDGVADLLPRVRTFLRKAAREAKTHSSWTDPNESYENALIQFVEHVLHDPAFSGEFQSFHEPVAWYGALNSLSQLTLKLGAPGVPDIYQGNESWAFNLVDPDNRRRVNFGALSDQLSTVPATIASAEAVTMLRSWQDGRIKMHVTRTALHLRKENRDLFDRGDFIPIEVRGQFAENVIAFARRHDEQWALIAAARFFSKLLPWPAGGTWGDTHLVLPENAPACWRNQFTGEITDGTALEVVFATLPFGILSGIA